MKDWFCPYLRSRPEDSRCSMRAFCCPEYCVAFRLNIGIPVDDELSPLDLPGAMLVPFEEDPI